MYTRTGGLAAITCTIAVAAFAGAASVAHYWRIHEVRTVLAHVADHGRPLASGPVSGPTIVEFADYQCPFCAEADARLTPLLHGGARMQIVFRHFPLTAIHPYAMAAAIAAECAGEQQRFEEFHHIVYRDQEQIGARSWADFAKSAGVPSIERFVTCLGSPAPRRTVERDLAVARRLGLNGTPAFIVGGRLYYGSLPDSIVAALAPGH